MPRSIGEKLAKGKYRRAGTCMPLPRAARARRPAAAITGTRRPASPGSTMQHAAAANLCKAALPAAS
ncbi:MAG: hypothetical protein U1F49_04545 [Rubrivivax sp.]